MAQYSATVAHDEGGHGVQDYRWYGGFCAVPSEVFVVDASRGPTDVERREVIVLEGDVMGDAAAGCPELPLAAVPSWG